VGTALLIISPAYQNFQSKPTFQFLNKICFEVLLPLFPPWYAGDMVLIFKFQASLLLDYNFISFPLQDMPTNPPDTYPITGLCVVSDPNKCPPGYELVSRWILVT
jgi:hypothetical protein